MQTVLRRLPAEAGKEQRGRVVVVGGSLRYPGAAVIAARAALRCGAGVVTIASGRSVVDAIAGADPNLTYFPLAEGQPGSVAVAAAAQLVSLLDERIRGLLVGPGFAHGPTSDEFLTAVLRNAGSISTVIDADGLNALARTEGLAGAPAPANDPHPA